MIENDAQFGALIAVFHSVPSVGKKESISRPTPFVDSRTELYSFRT